MKVCIIGQDTLAAAVKTCCSRCFTIHDTPQSDTDVLWVCYDTPIGKNDEPDVAWVLAQAGLTLQSTPFATLVLVSSQIPVGTIRKLEAMWPLLRFAYSPENIRVAHAVSDFEKQARIVVGMRNMSEDDKLLFNRLLYPFTDNIIYTDPETAEMTKHALNCYLGTCIAFINEIARVCKVVGADPAAVSQALLTERRVSSLAPLKPGPPFGLGHIARDIYVVNRIARQHAVSVPIIENINKSNV